MRAERARRDAEKQRKDVERANYKPPVLAKSYSETAQKYFAPQDDKLGPVAREATDALPLDIGEIKGGIASIRSLELRLGRFAMTDFDEALTLAKRALERRLAA